MSKFPRNAIELISDTIITHLKERDIEFQKLKENRDMWLSWATDFAYGVFACYSCYKPICSSTPIYEIHYECKYCRKRWCCDCKGGITNHNLITDCNDPTLDAKCDPTNCVLATINNIIISICIDCLSSRDYIKESYKKCNCF